MCVTVKGVQKVTDLEAEAVLEIGAQALGQIADEFDTRIASRFLEMGEVVRFGGADRRLSINGSKR